MTKRQARAYLEVFVDELPTSRERLRQMLAAAGADPDLADDFSPASLDPLWEVATTAWDLSWHPDYIPARTTADPPVSRPTLAAFAPLESLPSWFGHGPTHYMRFSPDSLWVIDVLGRHLGQCVMAAHAEVAWVPGPGAPMHNSHEKNWPIVGNGTVCANPLSAVSGLVARRLTGGGHHTQATTLREVLEGLSERFGTPGLPAEDEITVDDLAALDALDVRTLDADDDVDRELLQRGFQFTVELGDEARLFYDDRAPFGLDRALAARPGVLAVDWEEREVLHVRAPGMSAEDVQDAVLEALRDPRVRRRGLRLPFRSGGG